METHPFNSGVILSTLCKYWKCTSFRTTNPIELL